MTAESKRKHDRFFAITAIILSVAAICIWFYIFSEGSPDSVRALDTAVALTHGNPDSGYNIIQSVGCAGCHEIPGMNGPRGQVGPSLKGFKDQRILAGVRANSVENLIQWIRDPQSIVPGTAMPDFGFNDQQARDVAAYLLAPRHD